MAGIEGGAAAAPREFRNDRNPRGGERGPGRWRRSAPTPGQYLNPSPDTVDLSSSAGAEEPKMAQEAPYFPSQSVDLGEPGEKALSFPQVSSFEAAPVVVEPQSVLAPQADRQLARESTEVVITQADPDRPKKGGWWQRVRTPFGG